MFYLAQVFGLVALVILIISFQNNNKEKLLKYQIFSSLFYAFQYLCLNAISGFLVNLVMLFRNVVYRKCKEKIPLWFLMLIIAIIIGLAFLSYDGPISLLPVVEAILYSIVLWQNNLTATRIMELIACVIFIIYNINVLAITGLLSTIVETVFAIVAIYRFDIKRLQNKRINREKGA